MYDSDVISWQGEVVGAVTNIVPDMWYIHAEWKPIYNNSYLKFNEIATKLNTKDVLKDFKKGIVAILTYADSPNKPQYIETASYIELNVLPPWKQILHPLPYENELQMEIGIFHSLYWKKVRAIGIRADCDDLLFEVLNGTHKYAVVHLSYKKERSRKFPITHFYLDWADLFKNRLFIDHKNWESIHES